MSKCVLARNAITAKASLACAVLGLFQLRTLILFAKTVEVTLQLLQWRAVRH
jgi:hypothetical protein